MKTEPQIRRSAFSLVEILVVVAIILILAALAIPAVNKMLVGADTVKCVARLQHWGQVFATYAREKFSMTAAAWLPGFAGNVFAEERNADLDDYARAVLASKPAAYWRAGDMEAVDLKDLTGNAHGLTSGPPPKPGVPAQSPQANRSNREALIAGERMKTAIGGLGDEYSLELVFRNDQPNNADAVSGYLFSRGPDGGGHDGLGDSVGITGTLSDPPGVLFFYNGDRRKTLLKGRTVIQPKTEHHLVFTRQGQRVRVYLDGNPTPEIEGEAEKGYPDGVEEVFFGGRGDAVAPLRGMADNLAVYPRALGGEEIARHYANPRKGIAAADTARAMRRMDLTTPFPEPIRGHLKMGTSQSKDGHSFAINSQYYELDGKPWLPVMGEIEFSAVPRRYWEKIILQAKAQGLDTIASYIFWNHFEEIEGEFTFTGSSDIRAFAELCKKHGLYFLPRGLTFCFGGARNGGLPGWLAAKCVPRSNDPAYLKHAGRFFERLAKELDGMMFKDGGPVIGLQLENEFQVQKMTPRFNNSGTGGEEHMLNLKRLACEAGFDVPVYTATAWGRAPVPADEYIPNRGGYVSASRPDTGFLIPRHWNPDQRVPYTTTEMGSIVLWNNKGRAWLASDGFSAFLQNSLAGGNNLMSYYLFCDAINPPGRLGYNYEEKFYLPFALVCDSPLSETGVPRGHYHTLRPLTLFMREFGDRLAPMRPVAASIPPTGPTDNETLRWAVRAKGDAGFIFLNNWQNKVEMKDLKGPPLELKLPGETLRVPRRDFVLPKDAYAIWPFNMEMDGALLKYATAQPLVRIECEGEPWYFFFAMDGMAPEFAFDAATVKEIVMDGGKIERAEGRIYASGFNPGAGSRMQIVKTDGKRVNLVTLTRAESLRFWKGNVWGQERVFLTGEGANLLMEPEQLRLYGRNPQMSVAVFPAPAFTPEIGGKKLASAGMDSLFTRYETSVPEKKVEVKIREIKSAEYGPDGHPLRGVSWIWLPEDIKAAPAEREHAVRSFRKSFALPPGRVRDARFVFCPATWLELSINDRPFGTEGVYNVHSVQDWDIREWVEAGRENKLEALVHSQGLGDRNKGQHVVPITAGLIGKIVVRYEDGRMLEFPTDATWEVAKESGQSRVPALADAGWTAGTDWQLPVSFQHEAGTACEVTVPPDALAGVSDLALSVDFVGDTARVFVGGQYVYDYYFTGKPWEVAMSFLGPKALGKPFVIRMTPYLKNPGFYIDEALRPPIEGESLARLRGIRAIPEYEVTVKTGAAPH